MYELVDFLVEERYCNNELEALKIIESISDEFYEYLLERSNQFERSSEAAHLSNLRLKLKSIMAKIVSEKDPEKKKQLANEYKSIQTEIEKQSESEKTSRLIKQVRGEDNPASRPTPRGQGGSVYQKDSDVVSGPGSLSGVTKVSNYKLTQQATGLTGISPEASNAGGSRQTTRQRVNRMFDPNVSGGRGTGTTRTGGRTPRG